MHRTKEGDGGNEGQKPNVCIFIIPRGVSPGVHTRSFFSFFLFSEGNNMSLDILVADRGRTMWEYLVTIKGTRERKGQRIWWLLKTGVSKRFLLDR